MKEYERIQALSGKGENGSLKVGVGMYHSLFGTNESNRVIDELYIEKPEVRIFKDANNIVRIDFVYNYPDDVDLHQQYMFLERYFNYKNSVDFTDEDVLRWQDQIVDIEEGIEIPQEEEIVLYSHMFTLNIVSLSPRGEISLTTKDIPLFYQLVPAEPNKPSTILRMTFQKDDVIIEDISTDEAQKIEADALNELLLEDE